MTGDQVHDPNGRRSEPTSVKNDDVPDARLGHLAARSSRQHGEDPRPRPEHEQRNPSQEDEQHSTRVRDPKGATFCAIPAVTPHIALGPLTKRDPMPIVDMLEVTALGLRERGLSRVALFGTRFTIETALFGALDAFDVISPRAPEIDEIHRVYLELATAGHTSAAGVKATGVDSDAA
jgi:hypothetical protein